MLFLEIPHQQTMGHPLRPLQFVYLHCATWPIWLSSANAVLPPHPRLQTSYLPSAHFVSSPLHPPHRLMFLAVFLYLLLPLPPLIFSGFFNGMPEVLELEALNYYFISSHPDDLICIQESSLDT